MENNDIKIERAVLAGLAAASMEPSERSNEISMQELAALVADNAPGIGQQLYQGFPVSPLGGENIFI